MISGIYNIHLRFTLNKSCLTHSHALYLNHQRNTLIRISSPNGTFKRKICNEKLVYTISEILELSFKNYRYYFYAIAFPFLRLNKINIKIIYH